MHHFVKYISFVFIFHLVLCLSGDNYRQPSWGALDDVVMGGVSESTFQIDPSCGENGGPTGVFKGLYQRLAFASLIECSFGMIIIDPVCLYAKANIILLLVQVLFQPPIMVALPASELR